MKIKIEAHDDKHNSAKTHVFITLENGSVWYNQGINGELFYSSWEHCNEQFGYLEYYQGDGHVNWRVDDQRPHPIVVGCTYQDWRNQKYRQCEVLRITNKRARIAYELPTCDVEAWVPVVRYGDQVITSRQRKFEHYMS